MITETGDKPLLAWDLDLHVCNTETFLRASKSTFRYTAMPGFSSVQDSQVLIGRDVSTGHMTWWLLVHLKWIQGTPWLGYKTPVPKVADTCIFGNLWPLTGISLPAHLYLIEKVPTFILVGHIWKLIKNWLQEIRFCDAIPIFDMIMVILSISGSQLIILHLLWSKWSHLTIFEKKIYFKWLTPYNFEPKKYKFVPRSPE